MKRIIHISFVLSAVLVGSVLSGTPARAAEPRWQPVGPYGHDGYRLFPSGDPSILYVNTGGSGLYRSEDGGQSWREVNPGFFEALSVDPRNPDALFGAPIFGQSLMRSVDGGRTFQPASDGFTYEGVTPKTLFFLRHPTNPDMVFAQTDRGLFRFDGAGRWELIAFGGSEVTGFAIDPLAPEVWHASTSDPTRQQLAEMWISTDAGATWSPAATTPGVTGVVLLSPIFFDPVRPHRAYALANCQPAVFSEGAWRLLPLKAWGSTCAMTITEEGRLVGPLDRSPSQRQRIVESDDGGATWTVHGVPKDDISEIAAVGAGEVLVAVGQRGLWRSADGGATWRASSRGVSGFIPGDLVVAADGTVFTSVRDEGVFRSRDAGRSWQRRVRGLHADWGDSPVLAVDPRDASVVWAGWNMLHRSRDGGQSWQAVPLPRGLELPLIEEILVDPVREGVVYVLFSEWNEPNLYRTPDDGRTWQPLPRFPSGVEGLAVAPSDGTLYAWGWEPGLSVSTDAGSSWRRVHRSSTVLIDTVAIDPGRSDILWMGSIEQGVFRSTDGGRSFVRQGKDELLGKLIGSLAFDPSDPAHPYVSVLGHGIYQWQGPRWQKVGADDERFESSVGEALAFDPERGILYAWTSSRGIYRLRLR